MTISQRLRHPRADIRIQAKKESAMLERLRAELRKPKPWWVDREEAA